MKAGRSVVLYTEHKPSPRLAGLVEAYWFLEADQNPVPSTVSPDGRMELVFHFGCRAREHRPGGFVQEQPATLIVGQMNSPVRLSHVGLLRAAGIRFRPAAGRGLIDMPASELAGHIVDASSLVPGAPDMPDRLIGASSREEQLATLERFVGQLSSCRPRPHVERAVALIEGSQGQLRVSQIAALVDLDRRTLERQFQMDVGLSPKALSRIARFRRVRSLVACGCSLTAAAHACGYYDQAHMAGDFAELAGASPSSFRSSRDLHLF